MPEKIYTSITTTTMPDYKPPEARPKLLFVINGKRKSGKDYITEKLLKMIGTENVAVLRIAEPIKHYWAVKNSLDYQKLLDASEYKEKHRYEMVKWSMEVRQDNYGYFPVEAMKMANAAGKPIWICTDCRHKPDYDWFVEFYPDILKRIKIRADESVRALRGYSFTQGVDDGPSECDLDDIIDWDLVISNNPGEEEHVEEAFGTIRTWVNEALEK